MKGHLLGVLVLEGLVGLHRIEPFNFSFFSVTGRGIDLDYSEIILSCFRLHPRTAFQTLLLTIISATVGKNPLEEME